MAFKHLILGIVAQQPSSGYRIRRVFYAPVRPALSQIYRTLSDLADEGFVEYKVVNQEKKPSKNVYSVTKKGQALLEEWLNDIKDFYPTRDENILKIYFGNFIDKRKTIERLENFVDAREEEKKYYLTLLNRPSKADASIKNRSVNFYWSLGLSFFINRADTDLKWARKSLRLLKRDI